MQTTMEHADETPVFSGQIFEHLYPRSTTKPSYARRLLTVIKPEGTGSYKCLSTWTTSETLPKVTTISKKTLLSNSYALLDELSL